MRPEAFRPWGSPVEKCRGPGGGCSRMEDALLYKEAARASDDFYSDRMKNQHDQVFLFFKSN